MVISPVEVTVAAPLTVVLARMPSALSPVVVMPKGPVSLLTVTAPAEVKLMPAVPLAGVIAVVKLLTLRVVIGAAVTRPLCWSPVQVSMVPVPSIVQPTGSGNASAGLRRMPATAHRRPPCPAAQHGNDGGWAGLSCPRSPCRGGQPMHLSFQNSQQTLKQRPQSIARRYLRGSGESMPIGSQWCTRATNDFRLLPSVAETAQAGPVAPAPHGGGDRAYAGCF